MFGTSTVETLFDGFTGDVSSLLVYTLTILLGILAALLGLGYGIRHVKRWITGRKA